MSARGGEPAFPQHDFEYYPGGGGAGRHTITGGMSLRDWFAGQALASMGTWMPDFEANGDAVNAIRNLCNPHMQQARARWAYLQADAMLAAQESSDG